jgi:hypothetical protein
VIEKLVSILLQVRFYGYEPFLYNLFVLVDLDCLAQVIPFGI